MNVVDSSAWLEYFADGPNADHFAPPIADFKSLIVPTISLYGPTLPVKVGAYGRGQVHLCATGPLAGGGDRDKPCFDGLDAARVAPELDRLLASLETR